MSCFFNPHHGYLTRLNDFIFSMFFKQKVKSFITLKKLRDFFVFDKIYQIILSTYFTHCYILSSMYYPMSLPILIVRRRVCTYVYNAYYLMKNSVQSAHCHPLGIMNLKSLTQYLIMQSYLNLITPISVLRHNNTFAY